MPPPVRIQKAIDHILEMQRYDGGFALWSATGPVEQWLTAYAMDFLTRAKAKGYDVSDVNYQNGLRWLADFAQRRDENDTDTLSARAYALYVLATVGDENFSALRYVADNQIDKLPTALAQAQIGAALALHGDQTRAADAFKKAQATLKRETGDHPGAQAGRIQVRVAHEGGGIDHRRSTVSRCMKARDLGNSTAMTSVAARCLNSSRAKISTPIGVEAGHQSSCGPAVPPDPGRRRVETVLRGHRSAAVETAYGGTAGAHARRSRTDTAAAACPCRTRGSASPVSITHESPTTCWRPC